MANIKGRRFLLSKIFISFFILAIFAIIVYFVAYKKYDFNYKSSASPNTELTGTLAKIGTASFKPCPTTIAETSGKSSAPIKITFGLIVNKVCTPLVANASQANAFVNKSVVVNGKMVGNIFYTTSIRLTSTPIVCTTDYSPVCSTNGKTYSNACVAEQQGTIIACKNKCPCTTIIPTSEKYFRFTNGSKRYFVIKVIDPNKISEARQIIALKQNKFPTGIIVKSPAPYNPGWSFTLDPSSITFTEMAMEVCDASIESVQDHLNEVGGAFLPGNRWCPWGARLVDEVTNPILK